MAIVKGDRIGVSQRLSRCTPEAQTAYAHLISTVPDSFGRFTLNVWTIVVRLFPTRDDERQIVRLSRKWRRYLAEYEEQQLIRTWQADGRTFAEVTNHHPSGNLYHRTPEPPWSKHEHNGACLPHAIHRARDVGNMKEADRLVAVLQEIRRRARAKREASGP